MTGAVRVAGRRDWIARWHRQRGLRRMLRRPMPVFGLAVLLAFVLVAVAAPWVAPYDPARTDFGSLRQPPLLYFLGSLVLFLLSLRGLHWYELDQRARAAATAASAPSPS